MPGPLVPSYPPPTQRETESAGLCAIRHRYRTLDGSKYSFSARLNTWSLAMGLTSVRAANAGSASWPAAGAESPRRV